MQVAVSFRHMEPSPALKDYASEKLDHVINKYIRSTVDAKAVLSVEKFWHIAKFTLQVRGLNIKSEEKSEDMYSSIDLALDKLERQLRRYKDKIRHHKPMRGVPEMSFGLEVIAGPDEAAETEAAEEAVHKEGPGGDMEYIDVEIDGGSESAHMVTVLTSETQVAKTMSVAEAIMQMDLQDLGFLVFTRGDTGSINIIYKQEDGNYAIVETQPHQP
jgi:putative sigma-54 modulation protein